MRDGAKRRGNAARNTSCLQEISPNESLGPGVNKMCKVENCNCDQCLQVALRATNEGDRSRAWARWYQRDGGVVRGFVQRRVIGDDRAEVAEDLTQDAFIIGYQLLTSGRYPATGNNLCGLLIGIAKRLVLKNGRTRSRLGKSLDDCVEPEAGELGLDEKALVREVSALVLHTFLRQPEKNRSLLVALCVQNHPARSVAAALNATEATVRLHAHRAIKRILREIERNFSLTLSTDVVRICLEQMETVPDDVCHSIHVEPAKLGSHHLKQAA